MAEAFFNGPGWNRIAVSNGPGNGWERLVSEGSGGRGSGTSADPRHLSATGIARWFSRSGSAMARTSGCFRDWTPLHGVDIAIHPLRECLIATLR